MLSEDPDVDGAAERRAARRLLRPRARDRERGRGRSTRATTRREPRRAAAPLHGQGPRALRGRPRPHARRRVRPHLGVRRRARRPHPRQGPRAHRARRRTGSSRRPNLAPNHLVSSDPTDFPETAGPDVAGRAMLVKAARPVRLECVARGYLFGAGVGRLPGDGRRAGSRACPRACARPSGSPSRSSRPRRRPRRGHDLPLTDAEAAALVGGDRFEELRDLTLQIYEFGARARRARGPRARRHQARVRHRSTTS